MSGDPTAILLRKVLEQNNSYDVTSALFGPSGHTQEQKGLAQQLAKFAYDDGYIEREGNAGFGGGDEFMRVRVTEAGRRYLTENGG